MLFIHNYFNAKIYTMRYIINMIHEIIRHACCCGKTDAFQVLVIQQETTK